MKTLFEGKKLYAVIIVFLFIITFFITFSVIRNHYQHVVKDTIAANKLKARFLSSLIYEHQKAATSILESYSQRPLFIDAAKKKDFDRAIYHMKSLSEHHTEIDTLFITDQYGVVWANYPVSKESYGKNLAYRDWYKGVSKKWRPYISTVFRLIVLEKDLAVAISVPVLDRKGKVIGIFGSTQRTLFLATFIKGNIIDPEKSITLLDQEGNIIFSNAVPYQEKITKYPDAHVLGKAVAGVIIDMEIADAKEKGSISYVSIAPVRGIGWSVIVGQEKNAILKSLYGYFIRSAVTGSIIFLFLTVCLLYFRREYKYRKTKELLQAEEKYRNIFENTVEGIYRTTPEGRFIIINPAFAAICGYASPEEMIEKVTDIPNQIYANPEDRLRLQKRIAAGEKVKGFEVQFKHPTRGLVWVSINANALRDEQGNIRNYDGTIEDITERKQAEEKRLKERKRFQVLADNAPYGIMVIGEDNTFTYLNNKFKEIFGYDLHDLPDGKTWFRKAYPDALYRHTVISTWIDDLKNVKKG
ncbi:MAG: PAS domain S-box protein, partial [Proteobacteria bacterium]|nr:PAS domain S-box protein [Pseudomonadota bacterium]